jgi:hypothetical protein
MRALLAQLLQRLGFAEHTDTPPTSGEQPAEANAQPRIEPGSTLDTMASLNPVSAAIYADTVAGEIRQAITACTIGNPATTTAQVLEQIHGLKNAIAPTGSTVLLKACEQLRIEASRNQHRAAVAQRYKAVASATALLLRNYRRTLSNSGIGAHG